MLLDKGLVYFCLTNSASPGISFYEFCNSCACLFCEDHNVSVVFASFIIRHPSRPVIIPFG